VIENTASFVDFDVVSSLFAFNILKRGFSKWNLFRINMFILALNLELIKIVFFMHQERREKKYGNRIKKIGKICLKI
jgi:heme/copper-type cytochrome/quinol oxidase subunit 4